MRLANRMARNTAPVPQADLSVGVETIEMSLEAAMRALAREANAAEDLHSARILRRTCACLRAVARLLDDFQSLEEADNAAAAETMLRLCADAYACFDEEWRPAVDAEIPEFLAIENLAAELARQSETPNVPVILTLARGQYLVTLSLIAEPGVLTLCDWLRALSPRLAAELPAPPASISVQLG